MPTDERTPLLHNQPQSSNFWDFGANGSRDMLRMTPKAHEHIGPKTLYGRAVALKKNQNTVYQFTAGITNSLLLAQVVLGAAVTALGASESSHVLITLFGASNTIIAGVIAYLKSRGQPMRARMYRNDLERVVDEIENSEVMWLGISKRMHGYGHIDIDKDVTVRSEVARLTRLYDRAVRNNTYNNPDIYMATGLEETNLALRAPLAPCQPTIPSAGRSGTTLIPPAGLPAPVPAATPAAAAPVLDESPATAAPKPPPKGDDAKADASKDGKKPASADESKTKDDAKTVAEGAKDAGGATGLGASKQVSNQDGLDDEPEPAAESKPEK